MGCGKSKVLIDNMAAIEQKKIDTAVIVAPKGTVTGRYLKYRHLREDIEHEVYVWNPNPNKNQKKHLEEGVRSVKSSAFSSSMSKVLQQPRYESTWRCSFADRRFYLRLMSQRLLNPKAKRTKALVASKSASFRRILTGSPVTKSPMDLYCNADLWIPTLGHDSYYSFQGRQCHRQNSTDGQPQLSANRIQKFDELSTKLDSFRIA